MKVTRASAEDYVYQAAVPDERGLILLADFDENGLAISWAMAVHNSFKEALDIKFTSIMKGKKKAKRWTQGKQFNFKTGDVIWSRAGYKYGGFDTPSELTESRQGIQFGVQVQKATPAVNGTVKIKIEPDNIENIDVIIKKGGPGWIRFHHYYRDINGGKLWKEHQGAYDCTQEEFIILLKTGLLYQENQTEPIDFFKLSVELERDGNNTV